VEPGRTGYPGRTKTASRDLDEARPRLCEILCCCCCCCCCCRCTCQNIVRFLTCALDEINHRRCRPRDIRPTSNLADDGRQKPAAFRERGAKRRSDSSARARAREATTLCVAYIRASNFYVTLNATIVMPSNPEQTFARRADSN